MVDDAHHSPSTTQVGITARNYWGIRTIHVVVFFSMKRWGMKAFFALIILLGSLFYAYIGRYPNDVDIVFRKVCKPDSGVKTRVRDHMTRPSCLRKWMSNYNQPNMSFDSVAVNCQHVANSAKLKYKVDSHIPHFSTHYFSFFSFAMSENDRIRTYCTSSDEYMQHLIIDDEQSRVFWASRQATGRGAAELIEVIDRHWQSRTITSSSCLSKHPGSYLLTNRKIDMGWFYHPADATLLGSIILGKNACEWHGAAGKILSENISFAIVNRNSDRKILNVAEVISVIHDLNRQAGQQISEAFAFIVTASNKSQSQGNSSSTPIDGDSSNAIDTTDPKLWVHHFEDKSLAQQADLMRNTDVLLTVHGAAETHIAWMRPCAVVLEVFPWGFYSDFFGSLAARSGVLMYQWQEPQMRTITKKDAKCMQIFHRMKKSVADNPDAAYAVAAKQADVNLNYTMDPPVLLPAIETHIFSALNRTNTMFPIEPAASVVAESKNSNYQSLLFLPRIYRAHEKYPPNKPILGKNIALFNGNQPVGEALVSVACSADPRCRACSRGAEGVFVSSGQLARVLQQALLDRQHCIREHPFLAPETEKT